jgi:hypothetical protein
MSDFPKTRKTFNHLTKADLLRDTTICLVTSVALAAGLELGIQTSAQATVTSQMPQSVVTGNAINFSSLTSLPGGSDAIAFHQSHSSHSSHRSHSSHYSSR